METRVIKLEPRMDLGSAASLQDQLFAACGGSVIVDGQDVTFADTSCLQLLCAFVRDTAAGGQQIEWRDVSPALHESARRLGLIAALGLPKSGE